MLAKNLFSLLILTTLIGFTIDSYALNPVKQYLYTPDSLGLNYETHSIRVNDSTFLNAWKIIPAPAYDKKTTIIIAGGDAGNMSYMIYHASCLVMKGYTVVCFDYRGFGASTHFPIQSGFLYYNEFADDVSSVIQWSKANTASNKTGIWAFSMGTILSAIAMQSQSVDFFIAEGLVYNPFMVAARLKLTQNKDMLLPEHAEKISGFYHLISCKMLIVAGSSDQICTVDDSKKVCKYNKNRKMVKFKGGHMQGMEFLTKKSIGDLYIEMIDRFI